MFRRSFPLFFLLTTGLLTTGCNAACAVLGDFEGTFGGDASGNLVLSITQKEGSEDTAMSSLSLEGDFSAIGETEIGCEGGELTFDLKDAATAEVIGQLAGALDTATGTGSGDWSVESGENAGAVGTWEM